MSELVTSEVVIRDTTYTVQEMTGKVMNEVRKAIDVDKSRVETLVVFRCLVVPKLASESEAAALPQFVVNKLSAEIFRLTNGEGDEAKNA